MKYKSALVFLILILFLAVLAPFIAPFSFEVQDLNRVLLGPNKINWMGTDSLGRDLFSRIIYGARISLLTGILTSFVAMILGILFGSIAGYFGGLWDAFLVRIFDLFQSIPTLVLMILLSVFWSRFKISDNYHVQGVFEVVAALSIISWIGIARMVRGQIIEIKNRDYVSAVYALGGRPWRIILRHILPNIMGALIVLLTFQIPTNIMLESFLSFIGLGLQPPYSSWGVLANEGWKSLRSDPHLILFPGGVLFLTMLSFNYIGDGLRQVLDPKLQIKNFRH